MTTPAVPLQILRLPLIAVLLAGCAAGTTASPSTSEPVTSAAPSSSQAAGPSSATCDPGTICAGDLAPSDYASTGTGTTITFTLADSGWSADPDTEGVGFALYLQDPGGPAAITVAPWAGVIFTDPCSPEPTETIGTTPEDLMNVITALDGVTAGAPTDATVGGQPALQMDLTTAAPCPDAGGKLWVFQTPGGVTYNLRDATQARIYVVDAGSVTVVIAIEALGDADYEALLQRAEAIVASMTIQPAS